VDAHLLEGLLVDIEEDVAANVVLAKDGLVGATLVLGEPICDLLVLPPSDPLNIGATAVRRWLRGQAGVADLVSQSGRERR
jgi:hypothetical protein